MKKKLPRKVVILGRTFTVKSSLSEEQMRKAMPDNSCPLGAMNYSEKVILVRKHHCPEEELITFIHECLHAMQYTVGLSQVTDGHMQEIWCESGAAAMFDVFKSLK